MIDVPSKPCNGRGSGVLIFICMLFMYVPCSYSVPGSYTGAYLFACHGQWADAPVLTPTVVE